MAVNNLCETHSGEKKNVMTSCFYSIVLLDMGYAFYERLKIPACLGWEGEAKTTLLSRDVGEFLVACGYSESKH